MAKITFDVPDAWVGENEVVYGIVEEGITRADTVDRIWNGRRWVSRAEWLAASLLSRRADRALAYLALPWYKRLFTKDPRKEN
ncbi:hypothetical protein SEA_LEEROYJENKINS_7 [Microbacterium phage LeeroyJenkins]|nr:hypothetical protein SEA_LEEROYJENKINS_7 [Microbacterium phage LeeroyJenkins]